MDWILEREDLDRLGKVVAHQRMNDEQPFYEQPIYSAYTAL